MRDNYLVISPNLISNTIKKFERRISMEGAVEAGKGLILIINYYLSLIMCFIIFEDMFDIIKIDGVTERAKHEIKKQERVFLGTLLAPLAASSVQPVIFSVVKGIS